uniref:Uncharacterized protein n=1 Tax=Rhizophora mucronata TaxID=61149 RepID=A0A2P2LFB3_RHIMU
MGCMYKFVDGKKKNEIYRKYLQKKIMNIT